MSQKGKIMINIKVINVFYVLLFFLDFLVWTKPSNFHNFIFHLVYLLLQMRKLRFLILFLFVILIIFAKFLFVCLFRVESWRIAFLEIL